MSLNPTDMQSMYEDYFLDYASYVVLERAVPYLRDGLKPVQRRILHSMWEMDDGRYHKVANIVGHSMRYHPHGDAAIGAALVQLGQKELLIDTQGNWGNFLTGDSAAAPRYIEARLTSFAKEVSFQAEITDWIDSYDGRNKEPVSLPMKFPLLLAQGAEGIAVGLACKILPHNFNELIDGAVAVLQKKKLEIFPDFPSGGMISVENYQDGKKGGKVEVRAKILIEKKMLRIVELPFGVNTSSLIESILSANDKGRIKISRIEDNTAKEVDILVHLPIGVDAKKTSSALYAFTDCQISISPNACVIDENKPLFIGVSEILRKNALQIKEILKAELELYLKKLQEKWHFASLEKYFIEKRVYRLIEDCESWERVMMTIHKGMKPMQKKLKRKISDEDIVRLTEIKIKRISKYSSFQADEFIQNLENSIQETNKNLKNLTRYTISFLKGLKKKYGKRKERKTEITSFEKVDRTEVVTASETLYLDRKNGFLGFGLRKEEVIDKCSKLDDVIFINREGVMRIEKVAEKLFIGSNPPYVSIFQKSNNFIYSIIYREGRKGPVKAKRFQIGGITRGKDYFLLGEISGTKILHFSVHPDESASSSERLKLIFKKVPRLKILQQKFCFGDIAVKNRLARGIILTRNTISKIQVD